VATQTDAGHGVTFPTARSSATRSSE
jgi:hypothetical protein